MATNAERLTNALNYLIQEYEQHCLDRLDGKERVSYSLNGRSFNWAEYSREVRAAIKETTQLLSGMSIAYAETRGG
jgi:hypothetical protein